MKYIITLVCCLAGISGLAQERKTYQVNAGQHLYEAIGPSERYSYPEFKTALVHFRNGNIGGGPMNYNAILGEMEFINERGDTLTLADKGTIKSIVIGADSFFVDKFYLKKIAREGAMLLAQYRLIVISNHRRVGAMGQLTDASADAFTTMSSSGNPLKHLVAQEQRTYKEELMYFFSDKFGNFFQANKKNVQAIYKGKQQVLESFMADNNLSFLNEADMRKLLGFLVTK